MDCDASGVILLCQGFLGAKSETRIAWDDVFAVLAYKRDCYVVDEIRVTLIDRAGTASIDVSEHDEGYEALIAAMPEHLEGCLRFHEWFSEVAFPAFETNTTQVYRRGK